MPLIKMAGVVEQLTNSFLSSAGFLPVAATRTYVPGSALTIVEQLVVGGTFRWRFNMTKTAAGSASSAIAIAVGSAGTVADTDRVVFTKIAGTAAADEGIVEIVAKVLSVSATGVILGEFYMDHNLDVTGHLTTHAAVLKVASAGFPNDGSGQTVAGSPMVVGLTITTGAADAITVNFVDAVYVKP